MGMSDDAEGALRFPEAAIRWTSSWVWVCLGLLLLCRLTRIRSVPDATGTVEAEMGFPLWLSVTLELDHVPGMVQGFPGEDSLGFDGWTCHLWVLHAGIMSPVVLRGFFLNKTNSFRQSLAGLETQNPFVGSLWGELCMHISIISIVFDWTVPVFMLVSFWWFILFVLLGESHIVWATRPVRPEGLGNTWPNRAVVSRPWETANRVYSASDKWYHHVKTRDLYDRMMTEW